MLNQLKTHILLSARKHIYLPYWLVFPIQQSGAEKYVVLARAVSAAIHTPQVEEPTLISPKKVLTPKFKYEALDITKIWKKSAYTLQLLSTHLKARKLTYTLQLLLGSFESKVLYALQLLLGALWKHSETTCTCYFGPLWKCRTYKLQLLLWSLWK